jgi:GT2 family glycosyltransferase/glycosyltransferase involved in cell wall biosynthesis
VNDDEIKRELLERQGALNEELDSYRELVRTMSGLAREMGLENVHYDPRTVRRPVLSGVHDVGHSKSWDIVCFSIIDWEFRWQRPQQIMSRFAERGHRVFFISISRFVPTSGERCVVKKLRENVWEVQLALPERLDVYGTELTRELVALLMDDLRALRNTFDIVSAVGYVQLATWASLAYAARSEFGWRLVYDCMDEWDTFPGMSQALLAAERRLLRDADLLVVTGAKLYEKYSGLNPRTVLVRNAADFERFHRPEKKPLLADIPRPIVGYFGAIADWFDVDLLIAAAVERPSYHFVLIGGVFDVDVRQFKTLPNVHLLGQQPYELMPSYLAAFDVCTIPFRINPITEATDPVKFYEYISQGKPVVATRMHELEHYGDLLYLADGTQDFIRKLDVAVRENAPALSEARVALARENTWDARVHAVERALVDTHPRATVVIVTFGNLEVTKQCLESVFANTLYPNLEVIVVDNASDDGTPEYLNGLSKTRPNLHVILNRRNLGFAAANNQGLAAATGEILVLLNNDTVVPPGWLTRLSRHLQREEIGLVNAVTNFSGNESRLDVPYTDIAGMPEFARQRGRDYDGEFFDIRVAAMYCVAMRRDVFERVGPLDERFGIGMFEDDDYAHRMRIAGYRVVCAEDAFVHHYGQASFKKLTPEEYQRIWDPNQAWYETKWKTRWKAHQPRQWKRETPALPGRVGVELFFTKLSREVELRERAKAHYLEATHLRDELAATNMHLDEVKRDLFILQQAYEAIIRSKAWKAVQVGWAVLKRLRPSRPQPEPQPESQAPLAADAFAPPPDANSVAPAAESRELLKPIQAAPLIDPSAFDVICLPGIEWDFRFQRPQQLAAEFARQGHRVFYVSHQMRREGPPYELKEVRAGVYQVSLRGPARDVFIQSLTPKDAGELVGCLETLRAEQQLAATVCVAQLPFWGPLALESRARFAWPVVYDCMDLHAGFATAPRQLIEQEEALIRQADLISVSSIALQDQIKHQSANVMLLRNGCDFEHFAEVAKVDRREQRGSSRPLIGYYGAIAEWFDTDLVVSLARRNPEWDFVLIGSTAAGDVAALRRQRNISLAGERPYRDLPAWLHRFDVAIIPFKVTPLTRATNPVKAYEMLAAGKPIVSTPLPEMLAMAPLVRIGSTVEEFESQIAEALGYDAEPVVVEKRQAFARENTWRSRVEQLKGQIRELFAHVEIVAPTAEDLAAMESSEYPNVVSRFWSEDGTRSFREGLLDSDADVFVLARGANVPSGRGQIAELSRMLRGPERGVVELPDPALFPWSLAFSRHTMEMRAAAGKDLRTIATVLQEIVDRGASGIDDRAETEPGPG